MTTKRFNPYTALRDECRKWARCVLNPEMRGMWTFNAEDMKGGCSLIELRERVAAADQLGWDVRLRAQPNGDLFVQYVKRPSSVPLTICPF